MGFLPIPPGDSITASFWQSQLYSISGIVLPSDEAPRVYESLGVRFCFANSLNAAAVALLGEEYVEDEEAWKKTNRATAPFLLLVLGPSRSATVTSGYVQKRDDAVITHNCFADLKKELSELASKVLESAIVALAISFADHRHPVKFTNLDRHFFGKTTSGESIFDYTISMSATLSVSSPVDQAVLSATVGYASTIHRQLDVSVGRYYFMGLSEDDPAKAFLYHFFFLERYTHSTFRSLTPSVPPLLVANAPPRISVAVGNLGQDALTAEKTLLARFVICAWRLWLDIADADVETFKALTKERNAFSHGELLTIDPALALRAQDFASKVVRAGIPQPLT